MKLSAKAFFVILILNTVFSPSNAQNFAPYKHKHPVLKMIDSIVHRTMRSEILDNRTAIFAFNFSIDIVKDKANKTKVVRVSSNDSLAYALFPSYRSFSTIDYSSIMGSRKKVTLFIPILIDNSKEAAKQAKPAGELRMNVDRAINAAYALHSPMPYHNTMDTNDTIEHRSYKFTKDEHQDVLNLDVIYLTPYLIRVLNTE